MFKKILSIILLVNLISITVVSASASASGDDVDSDAILVKVGYSENYGIIKTPQFEGYEGYGYEYLHKIAEYTQNNYVFEFVECSIEEGFKLLENNEIQILAPVNHSKQRADDFIFSKQSFARNALFLTSLNDNYNIINNSNIAVRVGDNTSNIINNYLKENNLDATVTSIYPNEYTLDELQNNFDYFITDSMQMGLEFNIAINLGINDVYIIGNKQSEQIISDFDNAMELITQNEYLYKEQLYFKYFDFTINSHEYISDEEYQILNDSGPYNVGVTSLYTSYGFTEINEIAGLSYDIVNMLAEKSGMDIYFNNITDTTIQQIVDSYDFYLTPLGYVEQNNKRTSVPYITTPLLVLTNVNSTTLNGKTGVISNYMLDTDIVEYLTSNQQIIEYANITELCAAFKKGYVDSIIIVESEYSNVYNSIQNISHTTEVTNYEYSAVITFSDEFPQEKINIINKLITYIDSDDIEIATIRNSSLLSEADKYNFFTIYLRAIIILAIIIIVIFVQTNNNRSKALEKISSQDDLTGLYTQKKFIEEARIILDNNPDKDYTILCLDIDNFKYINEIYSYEVGSKILKTIANTIKASVNDELPLSRVSADNFLLLVFTDGFMEEIYNKLKNDNPIYKEINDFIDGHYTINFSLGSYQITDKSLDVSYMVDCCKLAHSFSKSELGTAYKAFSEDMKTKETTKNSIIARMNQALKDKEFVIYYQPKFDILTKKITGAEGLIRWFSNGNMIPPNDFIPLFEQNGFIEHLDYYVIERACEFINENKDVNLPVLSVNLSGITIMKSDVVERIMEIVNRHNISPKQIDLEITESAFVDHFEMAIESIDKFRDLGFTISMDDFGAGISSLNRLKEISIDILKIDREFIVGSLENEKGSTIIRNIILMAKDLRLETVAEGIETDEQLNFLRNLGCDIGQGYFFSRPLPESEFLQKLTKGASDGPPADPTGSASGGPTGGASGGHFLKKVDKNF